MKKFTLTILSLLLVVAFGFAQTQNVKGYGQQRGGEMPMIEKPVVDHSHKHNPTPNRAGGEDIGSAVVIPALPFNDFGNTCTNFDDYDEVCPYTGFGAPDAVYSYTPAANDVITTPINPMS